MKQKMNTQLLTALLAVGLVAPIGLESVSAIQSNDPTISIKDETSAPMAESQTPEVERQMDSANQSVTGERYPGWLQANQGLKNNEAAATYLLSNKFKDNHHVSAQFGERLPNGGYRIKVIDTNNPTYQQTGAGGMIGWYEIDPDGWISEMDYLHPTGQSQEVVMATPTTQTTVTHQLWNEAKDDQLAAFIAQWQQQMGQHYVQHHPAIPVSLNELVFPLDIETGDGVLAHLAVNGEKVAAHWSTDGVSQAPGEYAVVAAYTDIKHVAQSGDDVSQAHYYLFALVDGQPVVLHTNSGKQDAAGTTLFKPTANQALAQGFASIVAK